MCLRDFRRRRYCCYVQLVCRFTDNVAANFK